MMRQSRILKYGYHTQMTHRNFQLLRVLGSALRMKSEVRKILFVKKRRERLHGGMQQVVWWVRLEIRFL
jgi:hypothetical protein